MHDPNLNYLWSQESRANERHQQRLNEAEARRLANLAAPRREGPGRSLPARLLSALRALLPGAARPMSRRPPLGAEQAANEG